MTKLVKPEEYTDPVDKAIHDAFYDLTWGHGGEPETYEAARTQNPHLKDKITHARVKAFLGKQKIKIDKKRIIHNSFVPQEPEQEFQLDVMHFGSQTPKYGLACIDIFTKKAEVYPMQEITSQSVAEHFHKFLESTGIPVSVSTDGGPEFQGDFADLCSFYDIKLITLRSYPRFVDRFIRTVRDMIWARKESHDMRPWTAILPHVLEKYNNVAHSATGLPPKQLTQYPDFNDEARQSMQEKAGKFRPKPVLNVGDQVKLLKAVREWKKSDDPQWGELHSVTAVHHGAQGTLYDINDFHHPVVRADLLYVAPAAEEKPVRLPHFPGVRAPEFRLTPKQESQAKQYKEYLPHCLRILDKLPLKKGSISQIQAIDLPPEIKTLDWARLYPEFLIVDKRTVQIRPHVRIPKKWMNEEAPADEPDEGPDDDEPPPPPPPRALAKPPPPAPPPMVPPPPTKIDLTGAKPTDHLDIAYGRATPQQIQARIAKRRARAEAKAPFRPLGAPLPENPGGAKLALQRLAQEERDREENRRLLRTPVRMGGPSSGSGLAPAQRQADLAAQKQREARQKATSKKIARKTKNFFTNGPARFWKDFK